MKLIGFLIIILFTLTSCKREALDIKKISGNEENVHFSFSLAPIQNKGVVSTRSTPSTIVNDSQITDMWIVQFDNSGNFIKKSYYTAIVSAAFDAPLVPNVSGVTSNLYFLANIGPALASPANETAFQTQAKAITTESDLLINGANGKKSIPMFGQLLAQSIPSTGYLVSMNVTLTRMLAEVDITYTVDASIAALFRVEQVRVVNVPTSMQYYTLGAGNFPVSPSTSTIFNFQYETATPPGPTTITFYLPDNCRGVGPNTGTTNERLKNGVDYATYIELIGHTQGTQGGDEVTYRIYPGADNYNDYNIVRNTKYTLSTILKGVYASDSRVHFKERANCYMIKPGETINIPVKHANDSELGLQIPDVTTGWTASIYWQTANGLVMVDNSTSTSGYFKVTAPMTAVYGNAVVVIKDGSGNVLWSWQIWITDYDPTISTNVDVLNGNIWMKYNLGATAPSNGSNTFATSGGLMYQWGRKDPFPNSNTAGSSVAPITIYGFAMPSYTGLSTTAVTADTYVKYANASTAPISYTNQLAYSVKYPLLFLTNWAGSTATAAASGTTGINSWGGEYGQPKSVYDPCPEGWRVPSGKKTSGSWSSPWGTWTTIASTGGTGTYTGWASWSAIGYYPLAGYRSSTTGILTSIGTNGYYWSATISAANAYYMNLQNNSIASGNTSIRALANNVRCVKNQ